jgi:D-alanine transaminase/branched-chain amino acid aminotransferase
MSIILHNGVKVDSEYRISVRDLVVLRGYGLFDFFKVLDYTPIFLDDHIARLKKSCKGLNIDFKYTDQEVADMVYKVIDLDGSADMAIRFVVTPGAGKDSATAGDTQVFCLGEAIKLPDAEALLKGVTLRTYEHQRYLYEYKSVNYISLLANKPLLEEAEADDFLYIFNGEVSESSRSNVFFVTQDNIVITSPNTILEGITRKQLLEIIPDHYELEVRPIFLSELISFKEAFMTGSTKNVMPIFKIDNIIYSRDNLVSQNLSRLFEDHTQNYIRKHKK